MKALIFSETSEPKSVLKLAQIPSRRYGCRPL